MGQVLNFVKATVDLLSSFIDGAIDYLIGLLNGALLDAIPELRLFFSPFQFDSDWVSRRVAAFHLIIHLSAKPSLLLTHCYLLSLASLPINMHIETHSLRFPSLSLSRPPQPRSSDVFNPSFLIPLVPALQPPHDRLIEVYIRQVNESMVEMLRP